MRLEIRPITVKAAQKIVRKWHRHLTRIQGGLFATSVWMDGELAGVAIAGNPPQEWQGTGRLVITRVAVERKGPDGRGERNACSMLYGAMCRAAEALGLRGGVDVHATRGIRAVAARRRLRGHGNE